MDSARGRCPTSTSCEGIGQAFEFAGDRPAVVSLSLGGHRGVHDGTSALENEIARASGPGRVVVVSAPRSTAARCASPPAATRVPAAPGTRVTAGERWTPGPCSAAGPKSVQSNRRSSGPEDEMKRNISCPCGERITGQDEDDLVAKTQQHLKENHPGHDYSRDEILFMAY
jgi:hypothetical protein